MTDTMEVEGMGDGLSMDVDLEEALEQSSSCSFAIQLLCRSDRHCMSTLHACAT